MRQIGSKAAIWQRKKRLIEFLLCFRAKENPILSGLQLLLGFGAAAIPILVTVGCGVKEKLVGLL